MITHVVKMPHRSVKQPKQCSHGLCVRLTFGERNPERITPENVASGHQFLIDHAPRPTRHLKSTANGRKELQIHWFPDNRLRFITKQSSIADESWMLSPLELSRSSRNGSDSNCRRPRVTRIGFGPRLASLFDVFGFLSQLKNIGDVGRRGLF